MNRDASVLVLLTLHSPYITAPVSLLIGPNRERYTVPQAFLSESPQWSRPDSPDSWSLQAHIDLAGVNEEVGHTLVHYLYTGTFQKLQSLEDDAYDLTAELEENVHLYGIATKYGLAGLRELVLEKIQNQEGLGAIFDILDTIKEAYKTHLEDDLGLKPYIKRELKAAFESDNTLFEKERFLELFGEAKQFDRILMRSVTEIYSEKIATISQNTPVTNDGSPVESVFTPDLSSPRSRNENLRGEPEAVSYEEPAGCEKLDEYEKPAVCEHPVTYGDLVDDELNPLGEFPIQKRILYLEKESIGKSEEPTPERSIWDPAPRHDQAVFGDQEKTAPCIEIVPCAEEVPCIEVVPCAEEVPLAVVAPYVDPCTEADTWGISSKKKLKEKKAKKGKNGYEFTIIRHFSFSGEANYYFPDCSSWLSTGYGHVKEMNSQKVEETSEPLDPVPEPSGEAVHESPLPIVMDTKSQTEHNMEFQHADESSICASRATHLLVDDEWKKCTKCRALIHHLSLELARNMIVDHKYEYEVI